MQQQHFSALELPTASDEYLQINSMPASSEKTPLFPNVRVLIPGYFQDKIKFLCSKISDLEWSGILFYRTYGNFGEDNFYCVLENILLLDIGDSVRTSYRPHGLNVFLEKNPVYRDCRMGHIHSHHNMNVWFSSVDEMELRRNTKYHCYYLSVIVNNIGEAIGKFCYMAQSVEKRSHTLSVRLAPGKDVVRVVEDEVVENKILCQHQCQFESYNTTVDEQFEAMYQEIAGSYRQFDLSHLTATDDKKVRPKTKAKKGAKADGASKVKPKSKVSASLKKKTASRKVVKKSAPGAGRKTKN